MKLFEKKLGKYYLLELTQDKEGNMTITLYKKWSDADSFEATDNILRFGNTRQERDRAWLYFDTISLKTLAKTFGWKITK